MIILTIIDSHCNFLRNMNLFVSTVFRNVLIKSSINNRFHPRQYSTNCYFEGVYFSFSMMTTPKILYVIFTLVVVLTQWRWWWSICCFTRGQQFPTKLFTR